MRWLSVQALLARGTARFDQSPKMLASLVCATALACGGGGEDDSQYMGGPVGGADAGTGAGADAQAGQNTQPGQTSDAGQATQPGVSDAGAVMAVVVAGPPDLGENSQGDTFLRADTLVLKAPHLYATLLIVRADVTTDGQSALNEALTTDGDMDGFVDMSLLLRFLKTAKPQDGSGQVTPGGALCPLPLGPDAACGPEKTFPFQSPALAYANAAEACTLEGTQETAAAPCFATTPASLTMQLPILGAVPLQDGQIIGTWDGSNISNGWVRGFLPKTVAAATKLGEGLPSFLVLAGIQAGAPLTNFLNESEMQKNSRGEDGWWFLMSYTAKAAKFDPVVTLPKQ